MAEPWKSINKTVQNELSFVIYNKYKALKLIFF